MSIIFIYTSPSQCDMEDKEVIAKYQLPSEKELVAELGPYDSEDLGLIYTLINKLLSKSQTYTSFLEEMLHPDSNLVSMQEASMFSNEQRENLFALFRELTFFQRKRLTVKLSTNEEDRAKYFKEFYAFWLTKKDQLKEYVELALAVWSSKEMPKQINQGYFG